MTIDNTESPFWLIYTPGSRLMMGTWKIWRDWQTSTLLALSTMTCGYQSTPDFVNEKNYTHRIIASGRGITFRLWLFAARYNLYELEEHCRTVPKIFTSIYDHIDKKGVSFLLNKAIPLKTVDKIVGSIMAEFKSQGFNNDPCKRCAAPRSKGMVVETRWVCGGCHEMNLCD
jgi:hypothetical protein